MKTILYLLQKEFIQIFRNKGNLPVIFIMPIIQMCVLVWAATSDLKQVDIYVVDKDMSSASREITSRLEALSFFQIIKSTPNTIDASNYLSQGKTDAVIEIPVDFEKDITQQGSGEVQLLVDGINSMTAQLISGYIQSISNDASVAFATKYKDISKSNVGTLNTRSIYWFNKELDYKFFMAPGILVILVTLIGMFISGMNLIREKEIGTIEQINVTPIKKYQFIAGKLLPFLLIGLFDLALGLTIAHLAFDLPIRGNIFLLFGMMSIYLLIVLGIGLLISSICDTQQQVMFICFFFLTIFILMSGLFTPVESMPTWAQKLDHLNPMFYIMRVVRGIVLKGSQFQDLRFEFYSMLVYALASVSTAVWKYKKVN